MHLLLVAMPLLWTWEMGEFEVEDSYFGDTKVGNFLPFHWGKGGLASGLFELLRYIYIYICSLINTIDANIDPHRPTLYL